MKIKKRNRRLRNEFNPDSKFLDREVKKYLAAGGTIERIDYSEREEIVNQCGITGWSEKWNFSNE